MSNEMISANPEIAVLQSQVAEVLSRIADLSNKMDSIGQSFVGRTEYELRHHELDVKVAALVRYRWLGTIVTVALTAVITGLIAFFLSHLPTTSNAPSTPVTQNNGSGPSGTSGSGGSTATAHSDAQSTPANPSASQTSNGGATVSVPLVPSLP